MSPKALLVKFIRSAKDRLIYLKHCQESGDYSKAEVDAQIYEWQGHLRNAQLKLQAIVEAEVDLEAG